MTDSRRSGSSSGDRPVFPEVHYDHENSEWMFSGMNKREHYAALFVAGMLANPAVALETPPHDIARVAIGQANILIAMLAEADRGDA